MHTSKTIPWTTTEIKLLKENWPKGGIRVCRDLFPSRGELSISRKASELRLIISGRRKTQKVNWTPFLDQQVKNAYADPTVSIKEVAIRLGIRPGAFRSRAIVLGCIRRYRHVLWTEEEDEIVQEFAIKGIRCIYNKLAKLGRSRSLTAIQSRIYCLGSSIKDMDNFTAGQLAKLCGVNDRTIVRLIEKGYLKAGLQGGKITVQQPADRYWRIKLKDFKTFIRNHPDAIDLRKVDQIWFIGAMVGMPISDREHLEKECSSGDER